MGIQCTKFQNALKRIRYPILKEYGETVIHRNFQAYITVRTLSSLFCPYTEKHFLVQYFILPDFMTFLKL